jgi:hypothetical protein
MSEEDDPAFYWEMMCKNLTRENSRLLDQLCEADEKIAELESENAKLRVHPLNPLNQSNQSAYQAEQQKCDKCGQVIPSPNDGLTAVVITFSVMFAICICIFVAIFDALRDAAPRR